MTIIADRIKAAMQERGLRQVDLLAGLQPYCDELHIKMNKSDLSQYISGKVTPSATKLMAISKALNVSEAWLRGDSEEQSRRSDVVRFSQVRVDYYSRAGYVVEPVYAVEDADFWDLTDTTAPPELKYRVTRVSDGAEVFCQKSQIDAAFDAGVKPDDFFMRMQASAVRENDELTEYLETLRTRPECRMLFSLAKDATKADVEKAVAIIEALRGVGDK